MGGAIFPHPPLPGPCAVARGIRTQNMSGNPKPCPTGYYPPNPSDETTIGYKFFTTPDLGVPQIPSPPPAVVSGGSRKNKSRSSSRTMARKHSRRATRRAGTRKHSRKGSRKTRRHSRK